MLVMANPNTDNLGWTEDSDCDADVLGWLGPGPVGCSLDAVAAHLASNEPGVGARPALGQQGRARSSLVARSRAWVRLTATSMPVRTLRRVACSARVKEIRSGSRSPWRAAEWINARMA